MFEKSGELALPSRPARRTRPYGSCPRGATGRWLQVCMISKATPKCNLSGLLIKYVYHIMTYHTIIYPTITYHAIIQAPTDSRRRPPPFDAYPRGVVAELKSWGDVGLFEIRFFVATVAT